MSTGNHVIGTRPPLPPFDLESAQLKVRLAEDGWNTRDPEKVALAYSLDSRWRNRAEFANGRQEIIAFLKRKWSKELDYRLIKELWAFGGNRIAVRFAYEWHDDSKNWFRSYGNENWEFDESGRRRSDEEAGGYGRLGEPECTESARNFVGQCGKLFKVNAGEVAERLKAAVC